eukprot:TRINITY_DN3393_c0_g1_i1.p1 TRINITY_DN3393_c0_g1~~TRINITY_DN3393_c0_g1_i1.p1  ORF type:complete len:514 (+),score=112.13 TRINITY_DN3393_c0_g1_i1:50-1591(+)
MHTTHRSFLTIAFVAAVLLCCSSLAVYPTSPQWSEALKSGHIQSLAPSFLSFAKDSLRYNVSKAVFDARIQSIAKRNLEASDNLLPRVQYLPSPVESAAITTLNLALPVDFCRQGSWYDLVRNTFEEIIKATTSANVIVEIYMPTSEIVACKNWLLGLQIPRNLVKFYPKKLDSFWARDFGPILSPSNTQNGLYSNDVVYYTERPNDDSLPAVFNFYHRRQGDDFSHRRVNLYFQGGNYLANGNGLCITSDRVLTQNPGFSEQKVKEIFLKAFGCTNTVILKSLDDCATGHVDMYISWVNSTHMFVGRYQRSQDPVNFAIIEENMKVLKELVDPGTGKKVTIVRMPMPSNCGVTKTCDQQSTFPCCPQNPKKYLDCAGVCVDAAVMGGFYGDNFCDDGSWGADMDCATYFFDRGDCGPVGDLTPVNFPIHDQAPMTCESDSCGRVWRTYMNVVNVNNKVLVPRFTQHDDFWAQAKNLWTRAGYEVAEIPADNIIPLAGAVHCITKTIPAPSSS